MTLVKVTRDGQISLPPGIRKALRVEEGAYLEAEMEQGRLVLRPVPPASNEEGWRQAQEAQQLVSYIGPEPRPSPEAEEAEIYAIVEDFRARHG